MMHHGKGISAESNLISVSSWQDFYSGAVSAKLVSLSVLSSRIIGLILSKGDLNYKSFKDMYDTLFKTTVTSQTKEIPFLFLFLHLDCVKWGPDQTLESIELLDSLNKHLSRCCLEDWDPNDTLRDKQVTILPVVLSTWAKWAFR